jgi:hypothetical protein
MTVHSLLGLGRTQTPPPPGILPGCKKILVFFYLAAGSFSPMNNAVGNSVSPLSEEPIPAGLLAYWTARRQASGVADKRDIDPTELEPALLPFIGISEIEAETARIRYRLVGTGIAQRHGADLTGKYLDDALQGA